MDFEHVIVQCPISQDCFVRVSVWGKPTREAIEMLMQILTLQKEHGVFPTEAALRPPEASAPPAITQPALQGESISSLAGDGDSIA